MSKHRSNFISSQHPFSHCWAFWSEVRESQKKPIFPASCYWQHICLFWCLLKEGKRGSYCANVTKHLLCSFLPLQVCRRTALFRHQPSLMLWDFTDKPRDTTGPGIWCAERPLRSEPQRLGPLKCVNIVGHVHVSHWYCICTMQFFFLGYTCGIVWHY